MIKKTFGGIILTAVVVGCASIDPNLVTRPDDVKAFAMDRAELVKAGEALWQDPAIGTSGLACQTCHMNGGAFNTSFANDYPHKVGMSQDMAGIPESTAEQMVQFCMIAPMQAKPFPWDSKELAALTAYVVDVAQKEYRNKK